MPLVCVYIGRKKSMCVIYTHTHNKEREREREIFIEDVDWRALVGVGLKYSLSSWSLLLWSALKANKALINFLTNPKGKFSLGMKREGGGD